MTKTDSGSERIQIRAHGPLTGPTLVYLPGLHGDWTLVASLRQILATRLRFIEFTYPRTLNWSLSEYAAAVLAALREEGVNEAWLLAESFSSQVAWNFLDLTSSKPSAFNPQGLILAGGFIRYPAPFLLRPVRCLLGAFPSFLWRLFFRVYASYAVFRHRHAPETKMAVTEFIARRTPLDLAAILHRIELIAQSHPAAVARSVKIPVHVLSGVLDPIVPWWHTFPAFRRGCPAVLRRKLLWPADHNVLGTEPERSAEFILQAMESTAAAPLFSRPKTVDMP